MTRPLDQLRRYTNIAVDWVRRNPSGELTKLESTIPILLYHGAANWNVQGEVNLVFSEAVAAKAAAELKAAERKAAKTSETRTDKVVASSPGLVSGRELGLGKNREQLGTVTYVLTINLSKIPERYLSHTPEIKATFLLLLHGTGVLPEQEVVVKALTMVPNRSSLLTPLVAYLLSLGHYPEAAVAALVNQAKPKIGGKLMQSAAQLIVMRHSAEIEARGEAKGRAAVLIILLRQKFKSVPQGVAQRVAQASPEELDRWALRMRDAESPEAVVA